MMLCHFTHAHVQLHSISPAVHRMRSIPLTAHLRTLHNHSDMLTDTILVVLSSLTLNSLLAIAACIDPMLIWFDDVLCMLASFTAT